MNKKRVRKKTKSQIFHWLEPLGLAFLLLAFGWQCLEEHTSQSKMEGYLLEMNEKLIAVWDGIYDEALKSDRYIGNTTVSVNYDALNQSVKYWDQMQEEMSTIKYQENLFFHIRIVLYVLGSMLVLIAKLPERILLKLL